MNHTEIGSSLNLYQMLFTIFIMFLMVGVIVVGVCVCMNKISYQRLHKLIKYHSLREQASFICRQTY